MSVPHRDSPQPTVLSRAANFVWRNVEKLKPISENEPLRDLESQEKGEQNGNGGNGHNANSNGHGSKQGNTDILRDDRDRRRDLTTIPPWIHAIETVPSVHSYPQTLPKHPLNANVPHWNHRLAPNPKAGPGRKFDHLRSDKAVTIASPIQDLGRRWQSFGPRGTALLDPESRGEIVGEGWKKQNLPDLSQPWNPGRQEQPHPKGLWLFSEARRSATFAEIQRFTMRNPLVPLMIRLIVLAFVLGGLALGVTIYRGSNALNVSPVVRSSTGGGPDGDEQYICEQQASTYMAFIVDTIAVLYLIYITYDEYTNKPLGLRRSRDKVRLLLLDLLFIVFSAANLSLAMNTLDDEQWACYSNPLGVGGDNDNSQVAESTCVKDNDLCHRQRALCGILVIALVAWVMTFAISILRVIERISR